MAKKILVADDEEIACSMLNDLLSVQGYEVVIANRGNECCKMAREQKPDLIILDINMPDVSGCAISAVLEVSDELRDIPVLFVTGYITQEETKDLENQLAGRRLLSKPFDTEELLGIVKEMIG